jgi:uncharacterized protein
MIERFERLRITLGVSLDVFGAERVYLSGRDLQDRVLRNLQLLIDTDAVRRLRVGLISVLHRGNVGRVLATFEFCSALGLSYRILPVFSLVEPPARMRHLTLTHAEVVDALNCVADRWLERQTAITVFPLKNYLDAAVHRLLGVETTVYDPRRDEWAVIINTNGDAYDHSDAYSPEGYIGNVFSEPLLKIMRSSAREATVQRRLERAQTCEACEFGRSCSRIPLTEALPSERAYDWGGTLQCPIADPVIRDIVRHLEAKPAARAILTEQQAELAPPLGQPA